jgi:hypothetical protein
MRIGGIIVVLSLLPRGAGVPTRDEMIGLIRQALAPIVSFEFRFEGQLRKLNEGDFSSLPEPMRPKRTADGNGVVESFQGTVAYREPDGAVGLDVFVRSSERREPLRREVKSLLNQKKTNRELIPDRGGVVAADTTENASLVGFMVGDSPFLFVRFPLVTRKLDWGSSLKYAFIKWEDVEGRRCGVFELYGDGAEGVPSAWREVYWVDLERNGHPIRFEQWSDGRRTALVYGVKLGEFEATDGAMVWFPVSGKVQSFRMGLEVSERPLFEKDFAVVRDTLVLNRGLDDARFSVDYGLDAGTVAQARAVNNPRKLAKGTGRSLDERLRAELADARGRELPARAPENAWIFELAPRVMLVGFGVVAIGLGGWMKFRRG